MLSKLNGKWSEHSADILGRLSDHSLPFTLVLPLHNTFLFCLCICPLLPPAACGSLRSKQSAGSGPLVYYVTNWWHEWDGYNIKRQEAKGCRDCGGGEKMERMKAGKGKWEKEQISPFLPLISAGRVHTPCLRQISLTGQWQVLCACECVCVCSSVCLLRTDPCKRALVGVVYEPDNEVSRFGYTASYEAALIRLPLCKMGNGRGNPKVE